MGEQGARTSIFSELPKHLTHTYRRAAGAGSDLSAAGPSPLGAGSSSETNTSHSFTLPWTHPQTFTENTLSMTDSHARRPGAQPGALWMWSEGACG